VKNARQWLRHGTPFIWLNAAAVSLSILMVAGLLLLIGWQGLSHFWPHALYQFDYVEADGSRSVIVGQVRRSEHVQYAELEAGDMAPGEQPQGFTRILLETANRDLAGGDFRWVRADGVRSREMPAELIVVERLEWGNFFGRFVAVEVAGERLSGEAGWQAFLQAIERNERLQEEIAELQGKVIGRINYRLEKNRLAQRRLVLDGNHDPDRVRELEIERAALEREYWAAEALLVDRAEQADRDRVVLETSDGVRVELSLAAVVDTWRPNTLSMFDKLGHFFSKIGYFLSADPREANTQGGIFPAIFGTVVMVLLMAVVVAPFGVVAAVYLSEYARQNAVTRIIRITVSNLAGVPSIVYGVFGLGIFIYTIGGGIDHLFFDAALPAPTFGTGGLFWASLTLALLTLPVVIVSTEEGLARIPRSMREGSLALGATRWETLWRTIIPMASPGIITGLILAVARAAGEVAPLMLVGVVKLAPSLPIDGNFPYLHLERKFMHLGFHIYDVGLQSPNVEAAKPLAFATALLLITVVLLLNLAAINVRNSLQKKFIGLDT
jgi:phosphate transport system permease protein